MKKATLFLFIIAALLSSCAKKETRWELTSPNETVKIFLNLDNSSGKLSYSVISASDTVIKQSPLGIVLKDQEFTAGLQFDSKSPIQNINETYKMLIGKAHEIKSVCNEYEITFVNQSKSKIAIKLRAYNDGVAFRYILPEMDSTIYYITGESTGFTIPSGNKAWMHPYGEVNDYGPAYETYYENGIASGTPSQRVEGWAFPMLFNNGQNWILISEADVDSSNYGSHLQQNIVDGTYSIRLPEAGEGRGLGTVETSSKLPWQSAWRFIVVGKNLATIAESNMIYNLSKPSIIENFSWVKPGRAAWSWWGDPPSPKVYKSQKAFVDFAKQMGWEYSLVDANWDIMEGGNIEELIKYANSQGVGILMWYNSGGAHNNVTERPRDIMSDPIKRKAEFKKLKEWGVKGVKVDFFQSDKPFAMKQYIDILNDAAENQVMVNFHGCTLPRGWSRTYPNLISMEAIKGEECYIFDSAYTEKAPSHNTILPFTRNAIGPMDYTPCSFTNQKFPKTTSFAHELALAVVFESGIIHMTDRAVGYTKLPAEPKEFLKTIPSTWDETKLIDGYPGEFAVIARKNANNWYIGGISGIDSTKTMEISLPGNNTDSYELTLIQDGKDNTSFNSSKKEVKGGEKVTVNMLAKGGFAAVLVKK